MTKTQFPVIGELTEWKGGIGPTRFGTFETVAVHGLAWVDKESAIEILAIGAKLHGHGHFRSFLDQLKANYRRVQFWACTRTMTETLQRHGFISVVDMDEYGAMTQCCVWEVME